MSFETLQTYNLFVSLLALIALAGAIALIVYRIVKGPEAAGLLGANGAYWLAWLVAATAMVGSLIYSEVAHFLPCKLCWYQRIAMYPLAVILLVAAIRREVVARFYALPLAVIGLGISIYHYLVQVFPSLEGSSCDPANPCSSRWVEQFGFLSIPFMAGAGFIVITVLLVFYVRKTHE